jgi:hypothetical protein
MKPSRIVRSCFLAAVFAGPYFFAASRLAAQDAHFHNAPTSSAQQQNPFAGKSEAITAGAKRYATSCAACHGPDGQGTGPSHRTDRCRSPMTGRTPSGASGIRVRPPARNASWIRTAQTVPQRTERRAGLHRIAPCGTSAGASSQPGVTYRKLPVTPGWSTALT